MLYDPSNNSSNLISSSSARCYIISFKGLQPISPYFGAFWKIYRAFLSKICLIPSNMIYFVLFSAQCISLLLLYLSVPERSLRFHSTNL